MDISILQSYLQKTFLESNIDGLTIFSPNGNAIKHTELKITGNDIVIRNLHFKEMWQWDDAGAQKEVGWSNMKINGGKNIWVDHCTVEIASEGLRERCNRSYNFMV